MKRNNLSLKEYRSLEISISHLVDNPHYCATREGDFTKVKAEYTRNYPFNEFNFCLDENSLPMIFEQTLI